MVGQRRMCCFDSAVQASTGCCGRCQLERGDGIVLSDVAPSVPATRIVVEAPSEMRVFCVSRTGRFPESALFHSTATSMQEGRAEGVPLLIQLARTHRLPEIRRQAMFWLGQSKDPRAVDFFEEILRLK
jgi:hypothetical protein